MHLNNFFSQFMEIHYKCIMHRHRQTTQSLYFCISHHNANIYLVVRQCARRTKQCSATDGCLILPTVQIALLLRLFQYSQMYQSNWCERYHTIFLCCLYFPFGVKLVIMIPFSNCMITLYFIRDYFEYQMANNWQNTNEM